jgi:hypothetical protein
VKFDHAWRSCILFSTCSFWQGIRSSNELGRDPEVLAFKESGGEGGIRTLDRVVRPYNGLANRRIRPLCHLSGVLEL